MSVQHEIKYTWSGDGTAVAYSVAQTGAVSVKFDETIAGETSNATYSLTIDASGLQSFFLVSSQDAVISIGGTDSVQTITPSGTIPGGATFTLVFDGETTDPILYTSTGAEIQAELELLASVGTGNVVVTGSASGPWAVTFQGALGIGPPGAITATNHGSIQTLTPGGTIDPSDAMTVTFGGNTTASWNMTTGTALDIQTKFQALASVGSGNAIVTGPAGGPWVVTFAGTLAAGPRAAITTTISTVASAVCPVTQTQVGTTNTITQTTAGAAPSQTIDLVAGVPIAWTKDDAADNPLTGDVAKLSVSVPGTATGRVRIMAIYN